jgi:hypothetical protein
MGDKQLNDENYLIFAMRHYNNPSCQDISEFQNDLNRTVYIKRHLKKYVRCGEIKERLLINQLIIFTNVFGIVDGVRMICYKMDEELMPTLKSFLVYLQYMPKCDIPEAPQLHDIAHDGMVFGRLSSI